MQGKTLPLYIKARAPGFDDQGNQIGFINENNEIVDADGNILGKADQNGVLIEELRPVYNDQYEEIGKLNKQD